MTEKSIKRRIRPKEKSKLTHDCVTHKRERERENLKDHLSVTMSKTDPNVETEPARKKNVNEMLNLIYLFQLLISFKGNKHHYITILNKSSLT